MPADGFFREESDLLKVFSKETQLKVRLPAFSLHNERRDSASAGLVGSALGTSAQRVVATPWNVPP